MFKIRGIFSFKTQRGCYCGYGLYHSRLVPRRADILHDIRHIRLWKCTVLGKSAQSPYLTICHHRSPEIFYRSIIRGRLRFQIDASTVFDPYKIRRLHDKIACDLDLKIDLFRVILIPDDAHIIVVIYIILYDMCKAFRCRIACAIRAFQSLIALLCHLVPFIAQRPIICRRIGYIHRQHRLLAIRYRHRLFHNTGFQTGINGQLKLCIESLSIFIINLTFIVL